MLLLFYKRFIQTLMFHNVKKTFFFNRSLHLKQQVIQKNKKMRMKRTTIVTLLTFLSILTFPAILTILAILTFPVVKKK